MQISQTQALPENFEMLVVPVFDGHIPPNLLEGYFSNIIEHTDLTGLKPGETKVVNPILNLAPIDLVFVGMPKMDEVSSTDMRTFGAAVTKTANEKKVATATVSVPDVDYREASVLSMLLANYQFLKYQSEAEKNSLREVTLVTPDGASLDLEEISACADAVNYAKDLTNGPPNHVTPSSLHGEMAGLCYGEPLLILHQVDAADMPLLTAVGKSSLEKPEFIYVEYRGEGATDNSPSIGLVGKGITFDSGGGYPKPEPHQENMHMDMAGGGVVLAVMRALTQLRPKGIVVHGIVPAAENLTSATAMKVNDIYEANNGKYVEIIHPDAEGRLVLADGLDHATRVIKVDKVIDLATLTGNSVAAVSNERALMCSNNDEFAEMVLDIAKHAGEQMHPMPMADTDRKRLKSHRADIRNLPKGNAKVAGAITAACFLEAFVADDTPWVHLDIAGPALPHGDEKGATGFGVLTMLGVVMKMAS